MELNLAHYNTTPNFFALRLWPAQFIKHLQLQVLGLR